VATPLQEAVLLEVAHEDGPVYPGASRERLLRQIAADHARHGKDS
jgi:hypothetical protein